MRRLLVSAAVLALASASLRADDVHLTNGRTFEGVIAEEVGGKVVIQLPYGEMSLDKGQVERIEKSDSALAEYLARKASLLRKETPTAGDWVALARWAGARGLDHGVREAALEAAALDPGAEGLAPILRRLGYVFDDELGVWSPYADFMHRRGFVEADGEWVSREELAARMRAASEDLERRRAERRAAELAQAAENLRAVTELQLMREAVESSYPPIAPYAYYAAPIAYVVPGFLPRRRHPGPPAAPPSPAADQPERPTRAGGGANFGGKLPPPTSPIPGRLNPSAFPTPGKLPLH